MGQAPPGMGIAEMKQVFIIHGWTYSLDKWTDICEQLKAGGIDPVLLKVPGLTEPSDKVWDIDGYVDWLDGELRGVEAPVVIGHSNGGRIALSYVQKHPGRIARLVLIDSAGLPHDEFIPRAKLRFLRSIARAGKLFGRVPIVRRAFYRLIKASDYNNAPENMKLTMRNMLNADKLIDYSRITLPVTIIWGRNDAITPLKDGRKLHGLLKGSELNIIDGARHAPQATHTEAVAGLIIKAAGA